MRSNLAGKENRAPFSRRIMVVDDAECIRVTVREVFRHEGVEVVAAAGASECLQHLRDGFRGVILMDIMMPLKDGWDTIREIKAADLLTGNIIVMLTGMDSPDQGMEGLQEIVVDYITKPFAPERLVSTVQKYLNYLEQVDRNQGVVDV